MSTVAWVIGARGLLGSALTHAVRRHRDWTLLDSEPLPWGTGEQLEASAAECARRLIEHAGRTGARWSILWAAGAAVTSTPEHEMERELAEFAAVLRRVAPVVRGHHGGTLFIPSSVGGLYGGAANPPFTEHSAVRPVSPYGRLKLNIEQIATEFGDAAGVSVLLGRITNLYGPGQRIDKAQGLLTQLAVARVHREPVFLFVPLETIRDYVFADDAATLVLACVDRLAQGDRRTVVKIIGSGHSVSIASLLGYYRAITKSPARVVIGTAPSTAFQALDLRAVSEVWPDLDRFDKTPLAVGIHATFLAAECHATA